MERERLDGWLREADQVLAEEGEKLDELKRLSNENGTNVHPEQLVFDYFRNGGEVIRVNFGKPEPPDIVA